VDTLDEHATPTNAGSPDEADHDDHAGTDDDVIVLAWWHNPLNLIVILVGVALVMGTLGWVLGNNHALPDPNATDTGFLQDMRWHHEQAVQMSFLYLQDQNIDPALRQNAQEIIVGQDLEIGLMVQLLRDFGKPEAAEGDVGMQWMGEPTPLDQMPGMATAADLDRLGSLQGAVADQMFVQLMTAHHQGGIHMADDAAQQAAESSVRVLATQISGGQAEEITELAQLLAASKK
jgi:uncharacterized protein (DUF305 family)